MANEGLKKTISFEDNKEDSITAIVIFERGGRIKGKIRISLCDRINTWLLWAEENKIIENSVHRLGHSTTNGEYQLLPVAI